MTQDEKEMLMKDICEQLPFGVEAQMPDESAIETIDIDGFFLLILKATQIEVEHINHTCFFQLTSIT